MTWVEIINNASGTIGLFVAGFSGIVIALYQVKVLHGVVFKKSGELNVVTIEHCNENNCKQCEAHIPSMDIVKEIKSIQNGNIHRMNSFEEAMKEARAYREKQQEVLGAISSQLATLIANSVHMASDIKELKEQVKA